MLFRSETANNNHFIDGRCAKIVVKDRAVGFLGEIAPQLISSLKIKMPIAGLELDLEEL